MPPRPSTSPTTKRPRPSEAPTRSGARGATAGPVGSRAASRSQLSTAEAELLKPRRPDSAPSVVASGGLDRASVEQPLGRRPRAQPLLDQLKPLPDPRLLGRARGARGPRRRSRQHLRDLAPREAAVDPEHEDQLVFLAQPRPQRAEAALHLRALEGGRGAAGARRGERRRGR